MSQNLAEQRDTLQPRIDAALTQLGQFAGDGSAFKLVLEPSDEVLDAAVGAEHDWARGQLYTTVAEYLEQLNFNLGKMSKAVGRAIDGAAPWREVRFRLDGFDGGLVTGQTIFNDGRLDLVFRVDSLKTNQAGWSDIGLDMHDALARCGKAPEEEAVSVVPSSTGWGWTASRGSATSAGRPRRGGSRRFVSSCSSRPEEAFRSDWARATRR